MCRKLGVLAVMLLFFVGCSARQTPIQQALDFRTALLETESCSFRAAVTADYGDRFYQFTLNSHTDTQNTELEVVEPEAIAGIRATVDTTGTTVSFDDAVLEFGKLANGFVSPVTVPWLLVQCWRQSYIDCSGPDGELERVTYLHGYEDGQLAIDTWLDSSGVPVRAEIFYEGRRCITVEITDFRYS